MAYGIARVALILTVAGTLAACGSSRGGAVPSAATAAVDLRGSPPPLAALHRQASQILPGGLAAFRARMHALRGYPVVVMQWASWCDGCAEDLRYFAQISATLGRRVAFVGLDVGDSAADARGSLRTSPVSFPSYADHDRAIATTLSAEWSQYTPVTYFYSRAGVQRETAGPFLSAASLRQWIRRDTGV